MPSLLAIADEVTKVHAICVKCGALAYASHRLVRNDKQVMLGERWNMSRFAAIVSKRPLRKTNVMPCRKISLRITTYKDFKL